jgi:hypothetical protein
MIITVHHKEIKKLGRGGGTRRSRRPTIRKETHFFFLQRKIFSLFRTKTKKDDLLRKLKLKIRKEKKIQYFHFSEAVRTNDRDNHRGL